MSKVDKYMYHYICVFTKEKRMREVHKVNLEYKYHQDIKCEK